MPSSCWRRRPPTSAHPAFSKLFVQTEYLADVGALLATRRRRSPAEPEVWAAHLAVVEGEAVGEPRDRDRPGALPRPRPRRPRADRGDRRPAALEHGRHRARSDLRPAPPRAGRAGRDRARRLLDGGRADRAKRCSTCVDKHHDATAFERAATLAWTQAQVQLHHLGIDRGRGRPVPASRRPRALRRCRRCARRPTRSGAAPAAQSALWAQGISGDLPIVLVRIDDVEDLDVVRQLLHAHEYWRMKQLAVDLVILNERAVVLRPGPADRAGDAGAHEPVAAAARRDDGRAGRVFVLRADLISAETRGAAARRWRASVLRRRSAAAWPSSSTASPSAHARRRAARRTRAAGRSRAAAAADAGARVLQRARRIRRRRTRVRDDPRPRPVDAGAVDQRHRQSRASASRCRSRAAATPGRSTAARTS